MKNPKMITIVGGGLAGLTLGVALRRQGVPVAIWETGAYPRHRVCGEFVSGRGVEILKRFSLLEPHMQLPVRQARTLAYTFGQGSPLLRDLPEPAWCVSRFALDAWLANTFLHLGGQLRCESRWPPEDFPEGVVRATGRRVLAPRAGWHWFGFKAHASGVSLVADLEMHFSRDSYVGLCRLPDGKVNVCGLFRRKRHGSELPRTLLSRFGADSSRYLHERLAHANWDDESRCAVGGLTFDSRVSADSIECRVGDALAVIAPVTGNGMSMAFESAELSLEPLTDYAFGRESWSATNRHIVEACRAAFEQRLRWASWMHHAIFEMPKFVLPLCMRATGDSLWRLLFRVTR